MNKKIINELVRQKKYEEAIRLCDDALEKDSGDAFALADKAFIFASQKSYMEALKYIERAILIVDEPAFYFNKGRWMIGIHYYNEAIPVLEKGIELDKICAGSSYNSLMYIFKAYAEMKVRKFEDCLSSLSHLDDDIQVWIETQVWNKREILKYLRML